MMLHIVYATPVRIVTKDHDNPSQVNHDYITNISVRYELMMMSIKYAAPQPPIKYDDIKCNV